LKKTAAFCLVIILSLALFMGSALAAPAYDGEVKPNAVMLLDATTGQVLYEKNADERIYPASTTKILTCIVALENGNLDDTVTVGKEGDWTGSGYSLMGIKNGQQLSLRELLYGMMLISGNDAAAAIAVHIGGSLEGFAEMMNQKAQELGMTGSHFITPHGVDTDGHYVTARDMATLSLYAMKNEQFMEIVGSASYDFPSMNFTEEKQKQNTNKLLIKDVPEGDKSYYYKYATGIKTGATPKAYRCVVSSAEKDGMKLLCLIFGDETSDGCDRWPLAESLFEYGFDNYTTVDIQTLIDTVPVSISVTGAAQDDPEGGELALNAVNTGVDVVTMDKTAAEALKAGGLSAQVTLISGEELNAPVKAGDPVGTVVYTNTQTGETVAQAQLTASRDVNSDTEMIAPSADTDTIPAPVEEERAQTASGGISWIWLVLGGVLVLLVIFFAVGLIRAKNARMRKRNYARRRSGSRSSSRTGRR
jgi:D-alanyl-D-alanine carboxypeptidase